MAATKKRKPAAAVIEDRGDGDFWIDHAVIKDDDFDRLRDAQQLTLWNVDVPAGFLARLPKLWWLDLRGGTAKNIGVAKGCKKLRYLQVNQLRGVTSLALVPSFKELSLLSLYGLPRVKSLPSLAPLKKLGRVEIGMMEGLGSLKPVLAAPKLKEIFLTKKVKVSKSDVAAIEKHKTLKRFGWSTEDVPVKVFEPVLVRLLDEGKLDDADAMFPDEWFDR
jgi:hypothetical protein